MSISALNLGKSFTNYPNPFYPSRDEITTIGFVLPEDGTIDLNIYTLTGDLVRELAANSQRLAGSYQTDIWDGANDDGNKVIPGTYICQISVTYLSGKREAHLRKIAMLR
jgi:flagellar hook assembly protein FlgD